MATALVVRVHDAVAGLPEEGRVALRLRERDGLDYSAIGRRLGIRAGAVADILLDARLGLAQALRNLAAPAPVNSRCGWARRGLVGLEDGEIVDAGSVGEHVDGCPACATVRRAIREASIAYRAWDGEPVEPPAPRRGRRRGGGGGARRAPAGRARPAPPGRALRRRLLALAAAVVLVLLVVAVAGGVGDEPAPRPAPIDNGGDVIPPPGERFCPPEDPDCR